MKLLKLTVVLAVSGLFAGAGTAAYAQAPQTFVFTSYSYTSDRSFDGSTITIGDVADPGITGWDLRDGSIELVSGSGDGSHVQYENILSYTANTWEGSFRVSSGYDEEFYLASVYATYEFHGGNDVTDGGYLYLGGVDPGGTWSPVPDALNCFQLFALALAALGASHLFFRRQTAVLERK